MLWSAIKNFALFCEFLKVMLFSSFQIAILSRSLHSGKIPDLPSALLPNSLNDLPMHFSSSNGNKVTPGFIETFLPFPHPLAKY